MVLSARVLSAAIILASISATSCFASSFENNNKEAIFKSFDLSLKAKEFIRAVREKKSLSSYESLFSSCFALENATDGKIQALYDALQHLKIDPDCTDKQYVSAVELLCERREAQVRQITELMKKYDLPVSLLLQLGETMRKQDALLQEDKIQAFFDAVAIVKSEKLPAYCINTIARLSKSCEATELITGLGEICILRDEGRIEPAACANLIQSLPAFNRGSLTATIDLFKDMFSDNNWQGAYVSLFHNLVVAEEQSITALRPVIGQVLSTGWDLSTIQNVLSALVKEKPGNLEILINQLIQAVESKRIASSQIPMAIKLLSIYSLDETVAIFNSVEDLKKLFGWKPQLFYGVDRSPNFLEGIEKDTLPHLFKVFNFLEKATDDLKGKDIKFVTDLVNQLVTENIDKSSRLIDTIRPMISAEEMAQFLDIVKTFSKETCRTKLMSIPEDKWVSSIGQAVLALKDQGLSVSLCADLAIVIQDWTEDQCNQVLPEFLSYAKSHTRNLAETEYLLGGARMIQANRLPIAVEAANRILRDLSLKAENSTSNLLLTCAHLHPEIAMRMADELVELLKDRKLPHEVATAVLLQMSRVSKDRWAPLVSALEALWVDGAVVYTDNVLATLEALSRISPKSFDEVLARVIRFSKFCSLGGFGTSAAIWTISSVSKDNFDVALSTLPRVQQIISESGTDNGSLGADFILRSLFKVHHEKVPYIIKSFQSMCRHFNWARTHSEHVFQTLCQLPSKTDLTHLTSRVVSIGQKQKLSYIGVDFLMQLLGHTDMDRWDQILEVCLSSEDLFSNTTGGNLRHVMVQGIGLLPDDELLLYLKSVVHQNRDNPELFNSNGMRVNPLLHANNYILSHILTIAVVDKGRFQTIENHWRQIMSTNDRHSVQTVCDFIEQHAIELGYDEEDEFIQQVRRVQTVLEDGDETGAHTIFEKMKEKRLVPVDWRAIKRPQASIAGLNWRLCPEKIAAFGLSQKLDMSSVPQIKSAPWIEMIRNLKTALTAEGGEELLNKVARIYQTTQPGYDAEGTQLPSQSDRQKMLMMVDESMDMKDHFCRLLESSYHNLDGAKMRCVTNSFMQMSDSEDKWVKLCQFIAGVRGCTQGRDTAIQDYYIGLPSASRLKTKGTDDTIIHDKRTATAIKALFDAMQSVVSLQFSPESGFMREVCGVRMFDPNFDFAAHQIVWAKGLIGDKVGLSEGPRFDMHLGTVNRMILEKTLQEVMQLYYQRLELKPIVALMRTSFNQLLGKDQARREAGEKNASIYVGVKHIFDEFRKHQPNEVFDFGNEDQLPWVEQVYADDNDTIGKLEITDRGMVQLMRKVGIIDEITDPLGF